MVELRDTDVELLTGTDFATLVTMNADGSPQATITWIDVADGHLLVNTAVGRTKDRNLRRDPHAAVLVTRPDFYTWISMTGKVAEIVEGEEAERHIDALSRRYDGVPWKPRPGQRRVIFRIRPERISRHTAD